MFVKSTTCDKIKMAQKGACNTNLSLTKSNNGVFNMAKISLTKKSSKIERTCLNCQKQFFVFPCRLKQSDCNFCSQKCAFSKEFNPRWKGGLVAYNCLECGKEAFVKPSHIKKGEGKFCSRHCTRNHTANQNRGVRRNSVEKFCVMCGKSKWVKKSHELIEGTYCSGTCRNLGYSRINMHKNAYSRTKSGKREDLGGLFVRSAWEANYARYLNWLISVNQIQSWEYEKDTFEFPIKRGSKFYTPDFKVFNLDGTFEYHEVKGWMDAKSKTKLSRMKRYYTDIKLVLIDEKPYREIASKVGRMIPHWSGLFIEMKFGKNKLTPEQSEFRTFVFEQNFATRVCYSWQDAASEIEKYLDIRLSK